MPTNSEFGNAFRHDDGRGAVAATHVGDLGAALELRRPRRPAPAATRREVRLVAGPEEALDAAEQAVAVVAPAQALAGLEGFRELRLVGEHRGERVEAAGHVDGAVLVGEYRRLLGRKREAPGGRVVGDEARRGLRGQPLAHIALVRAGLLGELGGCELARRKRAREQAELVADQDQRRVGGGAESRSPSSRAAARAWSCPGSWFMVVSRLWIAWRLARRWSADIGAGDACTRERQNGRQGARLSHEPDGQPIKPIHVSVVVFPECDPSIVYGVFDTLWAAGWLWSSKGSRRGKPLFEPRIVAAEPGPMQLVTGVSIIPQDTIANVARTDIVFVPNVMVQTPAAPAALDRRLLDWIKRMHAAWRAALCRLRRLAGAGRGRAARWAARRRRIGAMRRCSGGSFPT